MKTTLIAGLVAIIAIGGALGAFAANRTVETDITLELEFWVDSANRTAFVSTRVEGEEWITHDFFVELQQYPGVSILWFSEPVTLSVPVTVEVPAEEAALTPLPATAPQPRSPDAPSGTARCCTVKGMSDNRTAQRAISTEMRRVIAFARREMGLTHRGPITINVSYTVGGLFARYEDAFGETLEELPSECAFQRGEHIFFGPRCRSDKQVIALEWFIRAVGAPYVSSRWAGVATVDYYWTWYQQGEPPILREDRYHRALFYEQASDLRGNQASDAMMSVGMLYAIDSYGTFEDWRAFHDDLLDGANLHTAFADAFGVSLLRFHADFEAWAGQQKTILTNTAYRTCLEAIRYIRPRTAEEGGGIADFHVPLEYDDDGDGYVCQGHASFQAEESLSCLVGEIVVVEEE